MERGCNTVKKKLHFQVRIWCQYFLLNDNSFQILPLINLVDLHYFEIFDGCVICFRAKISANWVVLLMFSKT